MTAQNRPVKRKTGVYKLRWILIFVVVCVISFGSQMVTIWEMHQEIGDLEEQKQQLISKNREFKAGVKELYSDAKIEELAREELGMIKPGEKLVVEVLPQ